MDPNRHWPRWAIGTESVVAVLCLAACTAVGSPSPSSNPGPIAPSQAATSPPTASPAEPSPTPAEQQLLAGMRLDLQGTCEPLRVDVPQGAIAAVACRPTNVTVDRATAYLFDDRQALLDLYLARMAAHGVPPRTHQGRCTVDQASEGSYLPGDTGPVLAPERSGCYVDAAGIAHYTVTEPPFVLVEVDGRVGDVAAVEHWGWLGNRDQPGGPTVWNAEGPLSPEK